MRKILIAGAGLALLGGCATGPQTQVTRFHLDDQIARGQIAIEPIQPADRGSLEYQTYASIVGAELARTGFTEAPGLTKSEQVAAIAVEHGTRESMARRSGLTVGIGGGSYGSGVGAGVSVPIGGSPRAGQIALTRLVVQIKRRSDGTVIWEGRAETSAPAGSGDAAPAAAVQRLAVAMFKDFPGQSGRTITVK